MPNSYMLEEVTTFQTQLTQLSGEHLSQVLKWAPAYRLGLTRDCSVPAAGSQVCLMQGSISLPSVLYQ